MKYVSTRGGAPEADFVTAALTGLARDGGLFHPETWPRIDRPAPGEAYASVAARVFTAFAGAALAAEDLAAIARDAYAAFAHRSVAPLVEVGPDRWLLELHHGPTLAFKDVAMQAIGRLYDVLLRRRGERLTVLCATSGDTGGAAAAAFAHSPVVDVVILHPHGRIAPAQRRFMAATGADNIVNLALDGDFDDCQRIVKALFADAEIRSGVNLSGVNSINWMRIAAQSVYYATAQHSLGEGRPIHWVTPTGNFGDALAAFVAARCGLLCGFRCTAAVNRNDAVLRLFRDGEMSRRETHATPSPAMDIQSPSNFERLLFEVSDRAPDVVRSVYTAFDQTSSARLPPRTGAAIREAGFDAVSVGDGDTLEEMRRTLAECGQIVCPHTAVALAAARSVSTAEGPVVTLATAHPAKFPETVAGATGRSVEPPERAHAFFSRPERFERGPATMEFVRGRVLALARR